MLPFQTISIPNLAPASILASAFMSKQSNFLSTVYFQVSHSWNDTFKVREHAQQLDNNMHIQIYAARGGKMYSNYVEIRKCCSSRNALKMLGGPGQPDLGRCHSVGTLLGANNNNTLK